MNNDNKNVYIFVYYCIVVIVATKEIDILSVNVGNWYTTSYWWAACVVYLHGYWHVSSFTDQTAAAPTLFPLVQCQPGTDNTITVGCLALDFFPSHLEFNWASTHGTSLNPVQYPSVQKNNKYTKVSVVKLLKSDWDAKHSFNCSAGSMSLTLKTSMWF